MTPKSFSTLIRVEGKRLFRPMSWRVPEPDGSFDAYKILVSEIMLQQTQVSRVQPKYTSFLALFPTVHDLADASLADVLRAWSGLGYNRRARYLHDAAKQLALQPQPWSEQALLDCKGIGINTARAVRVYAYNTPSVFIETNVRTVYIHYFFPTETDVTDAQLQPLIEKTVDRQNPRAWYWALMDMGAHIKSTVGNVAQKSKMHHKQSKFEGSLRQIRGMVLKELAAKPRTGNFLQKRADDRLTGVLQELKEEGLINVSGGYYRLGTREG